MRIALALVGLLFGAGFLLVGLAYPPPNGMGPLVLCAGFCFLITIACLGGKVGHWAGRILAGIVFLLCLAYLIGELVRPDRSLLGAPRGGSILGAICALIFFGIPAVIYAVTGGVWIGTRTSDWLTPEEQALMAQMAAVRGEDDVFLRGWKDEDSDQIVQLFIEGEEMATCYPAKPEDARNAAIHALRWRESEELLPRDEAALLVDRFLDQVVPGGAFRAWVGEDEGRSGIVVVGERGGGYLVIGRSAEWEDDDGEDE